MDETDLRICAMLNANSRISFRELAQKLDLSVQAVHKRVQILIETGVLAGFMADLSLNFIKAFPVGVTGVSTAKYVDRTARSLGEDDSTYIVHASGDVISVLALLRSSSDLERYLEFVRKKASMKDPIVALITAMGYPDLVKIKKLDEALELTPLDLRIVRSLHTDSRKEIVDIAKELGISAKTVKRRLKCMIDAGAIDFSVDFNASAQTGLVSVAYMQLKSGSEKGPFLAGMKRLFGPRILFACTFSNILDNISLYIWSSSIKESREVEKTLREQPQTEALKIVLMQYKFQFPTWREKLLEQKADVAQG